VLLLRPYRPDDRDGKPRPRFADAERAWRSRALVLGAVLMACGARTELDAGSDEATGPQAIPDGGPSRRDAAVPCADNCGGCDVRCNAVEACANGACVSIASQLTGLRWELPCLTTPGPSLESCRTPGVATKTATIGGATGATYDVAMRFRGVVETEGYTGGSNDGAFFQVGGESIGDTWNIYKLEISAPPQTYFLNRGQGGLYYCFAIDYAKTVQMTAGATVTLTADPVDSALEEIVNVDQSGTPILVDGVPPAPAPFNGQFIQVDVTAVRER
jgi:hypothetical protein